MDKTKDNEMDWEETDSSLKNIVSMDQFNSDDDTSKDAESIEIKKPKIRGKGRPYDETYEFPDLETAENFMQTERTEYTYRRTTNSTIEGDKKWFSCSNNNKCPKTLYLHLHIDSFKCSVYESTLDHNHTDNQNKGRLPQASIDYIREQIMLIIQLLIIL